MIIAICEDTVRDMEAIIDLCDRYAQERGFRMDMLLYPHASKLLADPQAHTADILLLDIMMPGPGGACAEGIAIARTMRKGGYGGAIIFTTSSTDFYPEGFEVGAAHYLIKPIRYDMLAQALDRAMWVVKQPERIITVPVNRVHVSISQRAIRYAEVYGRETVLHTSTEQVRVLLPLKKVESLLDGDPFLRCYRSYIINMDYVQSMGDDHFVLEGDIHIPISLRNRQALKERFFTYHLAQAH